ncbi:MAG TPA: AmmeMemoRadiSam system protein B [Candidatus Bathyarchaeia archaeon]|nr:AmmeMemoRadiSam system protein B [Candidatus Bathyarchaeia archaeon]
MIRKPAVAGSFYPSDRKILINQVKNYLKKAKPLKTNKFLRVLILPHAGYDFSGQVATWGVKQIEGKNFTKVIMVGCSHQAYFPHAALYNRGAWKTPLGMTEIDGNLAASLANQGKFIKADLNSHFNEHSLEVELPFLQQTLKTFKIVPILLGYTNLKFLEELAKVIALNFDDQTLLLISSDLSHYPDYETALKVDQQTIKAILTGNPELFAKTIGENSAKPGVDTCVCASKAVILGMLVAQILKAHEIKLFKYLNSGDITGDKSRVVGYASIGFYTAGRKITIRKIKPGGKNTATLNKKDRQKLLEIARQTLESYLRDKKIPEIETESEGLKKRSGVFVTLMKKGKLRGCLGEFEPREQLSKAVQKKAIEAALNDPRFPPLKYEELKDIKLEISVLSPLKKINDWRKIILGKHGVIIRQGFRGGTFLPQVAKETGWDLETFLSNLCVYKAGLEPDSYKNPETQIYIFTPQVFGETG